MNLSLNTFFNLVLVNYIISSNSIISTEWFAITIAATWNTRIITGIFSLLMCRFYSHLFHWFVFFFRTTWNVLLILSSINSLLSCGTSYFLSFFCLVNIIWIVLYPNFGFLVGSLFILTLSFSVITIIFINIFIVKIVFLILSILICGTSSSFLGHILKLRIIHCDSDFCPTNIFLLFIYSLNNTILNSILILSKVKALTKYYDK